MAVRTRRLPGFRFEVQAPPLDEVLPRMDIAVFVGFAAAGPLHVPVVVEDAAQFGAIFGDDAPLAWDERRGEVVDAYLAPAVRAFFRNGGLRCWVVRVAGAATTNRFPIPGLLRLGAGGALVPALAQARSPGSWSDPLSVGAALISRPLLLNAHDFGALTFELGHADPTEVGPGSLLRINASDDGRLDYALLCVVRVAEPQAAPPGAGPIEPHPRQQTVRVACDSPLWLRATPPALAPGAALTAQTLADGTPGSLITGRVVSFEGERSVLDLDLDPADAPAPGSFLRAVAGDEELWLTVEETRTVLLDASPPLPALRVSGAGIWRLKAAPALPSGVALACELLTYELSARHGAGAPVRLADLGFATGHPRCWSDLPSDDQLYRQGVPPRDGTERTLWSEVADPRFPLAGPQEDKETSRQADKQTASADALRVSVSPGLLVSYPLGMDVVPENYLGPLRQQDSALERDGLAVFGAELFLDERLSGVGVEGLLERADFLRYQSPTPSDLCGIHAALGIEEATIIAVPDAVQRGWAQISAEQPPPPMPSPSLPRPEWWHFRDCNSPAPIPLVHEPEWENFLRCGIRVLPPPVLTLDSGPDQAGTFVLRWTTLPGEDARYILEEAGDPGFAGATAIYGGGADRLTVYGRSQGDYYYRVRVEVGDETSDWSNGVVVQVLAAGRWVLKDEERYQPADLLAVQRALLRMCAARGDLFAALALPEHYREDAAIAHAALLAATPEAAIVGPVDVAPLSYGEATALNYGALYHPWTFGGDEMGTAVRQAPPDGAACGVLAKRALVRGCWVAPANEPFSEVVALTPAIARERRLDLQEAQVNLLRQEPRGFLALSADTLSADPELRPINVRRLLHLLRRLALRYGATYVFEPNDDAFRRLVRRTFTALLGELFQRGAFAGSRPETAYQVVTSDSAQDIEGGRLIVELRVAPAQPLTFLTVRLVQSGDRGLSVQER